MGHKYNASLHVVKDNIAQYSAFMLDWATICGRGEPLFPKNLFLEL
jgi:hypothetical protein